MALSSTERVRQIVDCITAESIAPSLDSTTWQIMPKCCLKIRFAAIFLNGN